MLGIVSIVHLLSMNHIYADQGYYGKLSSSIIYSACNIVTLISSQK